MSKTLQERYQAALERSGERVVKRLNSGVIVMTRTKGSHYYLGPSGSLRVGPTREGSLPASDKFKMLLLRDPALEGKS